MIAAVTTPQREALDRIYVSGRHFIERERILSTYRGRMAELLAQEHLDIAGETRESWFEGGRFKDSWWEAHKHTRESHRKLQSSHLPGTFNRAFDEQAIRDHAENYARLCSRMDSLESRQSFALPQGVEPPNGKTITEKGAVARLDHPLWWRSQLRKAWTRGAENGMREFGMVRKDREPYASDDAVNHKRAQQRRTRDFLDSHALVNEVGEQLSLLDVAERSLANPALRRGEFMCRVRGFEEYATEQGHIPLFFTLTAPSAFHAQLSEGGRNPRYNGATVRDGQIWLRKQWARGRAKLARLSILYYGVRVAEPHHDGTPHWHVLVFTPAKHEDALRAVVLGYWWAEFKDELTTEAAREARAQCKRIDPEKGSAVGYVAKYVSKNIDAAGTIGEEISDETGTPVSETVQRVAAWASVHGIKQFQQMGGPPVGVWREARRKREPVDADRIEPIRAAADAGQWNGYIQEMGGIERARRRVSSVRSKYGRTVKPPMIRYRGGPRGGWRLRPATPEEMPTVWLDRAEARATDRAGREVFAVTRYDEQPGPRAAGLCAYGLMGRYQSVDTRPHRWRIERAEQRAATGNDTECGQPCPSKVDRRTCSSGKQGHRARAGDSVAPVGAGGAGRWVYGRGGRGSGVLIEPDSSRGARIDEFLKSWRPVDRRAEDREWALFLSSLSSSSSSIFSSLGPVAITVRGAPAAGESSTWSNPQQSSRAGPE